MQNPSAQPLLPYTARSRTTHGDSHWIKDEKYSTRVKDEDGYPSFALVNKVTGEALKHSIGATHPMFMTGMGAINLNIDSMRGYGYLKACKFTQIITPNIKQINITKSNQHNWEKRDGTRKSWVLLQMQTTAIEEDETLKTIAAVGEEDDY
ncbi:hypothetical protein ACLOJK_025074 [Asimina triloba]